MTNSVFGFLRCYVLLAVAAGAGGVAAGYDREQLATYVWLGQGLLALVFVWGWWDLAERIRTGEVATDLLRPVDPVLLGALAFDLYLPSRLGTWPLFVVSAALAVVVSFGCRFLVNAIAYWLLDLRGVASAWALGATILCGLYFPLRFLPDWLAALLYLGTPFPSILQIPADVLIERDPPAMQAGLVGVQAVWAVATLAACRAVQRRAERRLVIQGG